ncbi:MAG: CBS domain-containing protein [Myxococcota bacterium]
MSQVPALEDADQSGTKSALWSGMDQPTPREERAALALRTVRTLMRANFISIAPEDTLLEADRIMRLARIRHLPVVRNGLLVALLSHRDVLSASISALEKVDPVERLDHLRRIPVAEVMRGSLYTATEDTTLADAARRMLRAKIGCLPVVRPGPDGPTLCGLITESDLLRAAYAPDFTGASD